MALPAAHGDAHDALRAAPARSARADGEHRDEADRAAPSRSAALVPLRARGAAAEPGTRARLAADVRDARPLRPRADARLPRVVNGTQPCAVRAPRVPDDGGDPH